jgi:hypothetical protein
VRFYRAGMHGFVLLAACTGESGRSSGARGHSSTAAHVDASTALRAESSTAGRPCLTFPRSDWTPARVGTATFVVNRATRGMAARVRWVLAPDSSAIIAVEDPAGVENEAVPDGVLFATERTGRTWQMDSVWSASPSPDWTRVAVGRGVVVSGGEQQVVAPSRWQGAAQSLAAIAGPQPAINAESLRAHSYPVSGMAVAEGAAATFVAGVAREEREAPVHFVSLDGWRVRWSCDGHDVLIGVRPRRVQDDQPANDERRVAVQGGPVSTAPAADAVAWTDGPTLDISVPISRMPGSLRVRARVIDGSSRGITVRDSSSAGWSAPRSVGAGIPLAATRSGRFILAIAPRTDAKPYESRDHAVVYRVP